jgi:hypothetical protein
MSATPVLDFAGVFAEELLFTTRTLGGGYDKNLPPCRGLWMTMPLWTIAEHVFDDRADTPEQAYENESVQASGYAVGVSGHHGAPDSSRFHTLSNGFVDGSPVQIGECVIGGQTPRIGRAE